jgi:cell division protein FtsZ
MGVGEHEGENAAYEAIKAAIESPLLDNMSINGAMGVLVHFHMHPNFPMMATSEAMIVVQESAHEDADVIFGTSTNDTLPEDYVKITIIATGFEKELGTINNPDGPAEPVVSTPRLQPRLVVGGDFSGDQLDIPSYMRQQQD